MFEPTIDSLLCLPVAGFREVGLDYRQRARPHRVERHLAYHLGRTGNNLNQLARVANTYSGAKARNPRALAQNLRTDPRGIPDPSRDREDLDR